jgi:hypothetical protein
MCISYMTYGIVLVLHFDSLVEAFAGRLQVPEDLYNPGAKYYDIQIYHCQEK